MMSACGHSIVSTPLQPSRISRLSVAAAFCAGLLLGASQPGYAAHIEAPADLLYRVALEDRDKGYLDSAIHELHKVLLIDPDHVLARRELKRLEALRGKRGEAMEFALESASRPSGMSRVSEAPSPLPVVGPLPVAAPMSQERWVRVPDPQINRVEWLYVFGRQGDVTYGGLQAPQSLFVELPPGMARPVRIRVVDADVRGRHDELDGAADTVTVFRVFKEATLLDEQAIGPDVRDGTVIEFGPFEGSGFRVEAEGISGNDNNLFALEINAPEAQVFSHQLSIRLAERPRERMRFFPLVPQGATHLTEENYDVDPDGGRALLVPVTSGGQAHPPVRLASSGSGRWASTEVAVPPGTDGARWNYEIIKETQRKGNMSFRLKDQAQQPLPIYMARERLTAYTTPGLVVQAVSEQACTTLTFDGSQSTDPDGEPLTYLWDFGDGTTAQGPRVRHTYSQTGAFPVSLTVTDSSSTSCCQDRREQVLVVKARPQATIDAPPAGCAGMPLTFSAVHAEETMLRPLTYRWDFGDGETAEGEAVTHAYLRGGAYTVSLTVDDGEGTPCSSGVATAAVRVNTPPLAQANGPVVRCAARPEDPLKVDLSAHESSDPDGDRLSYRWDFGDGTADSGARVSHQYARGGRYQAVVTVDDGRGLSCSTSSALVPVQVNHAPIARTAPAVSGCPGEAVVFDGSQTTDPDGDPLTYRWEFGDGQTAEGVSPAHTYRASGAYRAVVTVDDGTGTACGTSSAECAARINAPPAATMSIQSDAEASPASRRPIHTE